MPEIPRDPSFDGTLALMRDPYGYVSERCRRHGSDLFETRLMLRKTVCMAGPAAAELFYDESRFTRSGVAPGWLRETLFGRGGVQGLDGEAHRHRKRMFLSLVTPERVAELGRVTADKWRACARKWAAAGRVVLYDGLTELHTRAVCAWAGVPLEESEVARRTAELTAMFEKAAAIGPGHLWSRGARDLAERWIGGVIDEVRAGRLVPPEESAAWVVARHRDLNGDFLDRHTAEVELINVLRPTIAVSVYVLLAAHALHEHPECREKLWADAGYAEPFAQEVRRFYPFFPAVVARARHGFEWNGYRFPRGRRVLLDLHGTNRDPRSWESPDEFRPERFRVREVGPSGFVPQGGGDRLANHRCPGEPISLELMRVAADFLVNRLSYEVPDQDLRIDRSRVPALPRSRFAIDGVREATR